MSTLQTKSGNKLFKANVLVDGVELKQDGDKVKAALNGEIIGTVTGDFVVVEGKKLKIESLKPALNPADLVGKDHTTLSPEETIALIEYLKEQAQLNAAAPAEKKTTKKTKAVVVEETEEIEEEEDGDKEVSLPEGIETYEQLAKLGVKELWVIAKPLSIDDINSRTKKGPMLEALAEFFDLSPAEEEAEEEIDEDELEEVLEEEEEKPKRRSKKAPVVEEDEEDEDEDEEEDDDEFDDDDSDDDSDDDEEDDEDFEDDEEDEEDDDTEDEEDEEEDDEDYDEEEEDDDEDDEEEDEVTEKDIDAVFATKNKAAIVAFCKKHGAKIPKKQITMIKLKEIIKDQLLGDDE